MGCSENKDPRKTNLRSLRPKTRNQRLNENIARPVHKKFKNLEQQWSAPHYIK